jgi:hypothetical protein
MTPDGIDTADWDQVHELAVEIVNASAEGDDAASDSASIRLRELLDQLQQKYGPLPSLLATRADYAERPADREYWLLAAYTEAAKLGDKRNQALVAESLASFYIEEQPDQEQGKRWLAVLASHDGESVLDEVARLRAMLDRQP